MSKKKGLYALTIGALVGFVTGILTAPKSGKETREDIKDTASKWAKDAEKQLKKAQKSLSKQLKSLEAKGTEYKGKAQQEVELLKKKGALVQEHLKALLDDLKTGKAEEADVDKAVSVTEATKKKIARVRKKATKTKKK